MTHQQRATDLADLEQRVRSFLAAEAPRRSPESLLDRVHGIRPSLAGTARVRVLLDSPMQRVVGWHRDEPRKHGVTWSPVALVWTALALAGALLIASGVPVFIGSSDGGRSPMAVIQTTETPWLFASSPVDCVTHRDPPAPEPGPLPEAGPPVRTMQNGPIVAVNRFGVTLFIDPDTGETIHEGPRFSVERFVGGVPVSGLHRWSPDGRWVSGTLDQVSGSPPGRPSLACGDYHLVSSDGRTLSRIFVQGDHGWGSAAWSPDGRWLAIASESDDGRETRIDVSRVEDDGTLSQGRRVVTLEDGWDIQSLAWGPDGTLAWESSDSDGESHTIGLLRPGSSESGVIELGQVRLINPRWSSDGSVLAAVGVEGDDIVGRIYVVRPENGTVRALDLPVHPISGKYAWDAEVPTSSDGRVYFPAYGDPVAVHDVYSVNVDGTELQNLTAEPADDGVDHPRPFNVMLSPDETQIAFQSEVGVLLTVATGGGQVHAPLSQGPAQEVRWIPSWQPVP